MAKYFWSVDSGGLASDWGVVFGNASFSVETDGSGRGYLLIARPSNTTEFTNLASINGEAIPQVADFEIYIEAQGDAGAEQDMRAGGRFSGTSFGNSSFLTAGYEGGQNRLRVTQLNAGSESNLSTVVKDLPAGTLLSQRSQFVGSNAKTKLWEAANSEPVAWDLENASAVITAAGQYGIYRFAAESLRVYGVGIGTNGDPAPTSAEQTGPSLSITDPLIPGTATTISTSGNESPWTGARITDASGNIKEITLASQTSVSAPALGTQDYCQFGTVTLEVYNATESATASATFDPPAAYEFLVTLPATPSNLTNTGYLFNWSPDNGHEGVQVISPFEIDTNGNIVLAPSDGVYTLYSIDDFDGEMQGFTVTIQDGEVVSVGRFTRRNLTRRTFTRRSLTARP